MTISRLSSTSETLQVQSTTFSGTDEKTNESVFSKYDTNNDSIISKEEQIDVLNQKLLNDEIIQKAEKKGFAISDVLNTARQLLSDLTGGINDESRVESRIEGFMNFARTHATSLLLGGRTAYTKDSDTVFYNDGYRCGNNEHYTSESPALYYSDGDTRIEAWVENGEIESLNVRDNMTHNTIEERRDYDGDGKAEHIIYRKYDEKGNEIQQDQDINGDGIIDRRYTMEYDANNNEIKENVDLDMDGVIDKVKYKN